MSEHTVSEQGARRGLDRGAVSEEGAPPGPGLRSRRAEGADGDEGRPGLQERRPCGQSDGAFPDGFLWGATTSAYQIEGAVTADGRGESIWDSFCRRPGAVAGGDTGEVACDHFHRYAEDVDLLAWLGLRAYRFSVAWPRIQPSGSGTANEKGLGFYDRLVDLLLARGVLPMITLYHWDLPQALQDGGGWAARETAQRFADFAAVVAARLGDRVRHWTTLNEPWCSAFLGYGSGLHAPGIKDQAQSLRAAHHLLLAHGLGMQALRAGLPDDAQLAIALNVHQFDPASSSPADLAATRRVDAVANRVFLDPLFHATYPEDLLAATADLSDWRFVRPGDLDRIAAPIDALGVNYYCPTKVSARPTWVPGDEPVNEAFPGCEQVELSWAPGEHTAMGWPVDPSGLARLLVRLSGDLPGVPLMVTENGAADNTGPSEGTVDDRARIDYLARHVAAAREAIRLGVDLRGYFVWSLLDNLEWTWGYAQRFGLIHVDYTSGRRTPKRSAGWFRELIGTGGGGSAA